MPAVVSPAGAGIEISDVNQSLWQYLKKRKLRMLILVVTLVLLWEAALLYSIYITDWTSTSSTSTNGANVILYLMVLPFVLFAAWLQRVRRQFEDAFLEEFALVNHYAFDKTGTVDETYGSVFRLEGQHAVSDVVGGTYVGHPLRLFLHELVVRRGRSSSRFHTTVLELDVRGRLPNLLLVYKEFRFGRVNFIDAFGVTNTITLEGDFGRHFTLYAQPGNEIEALEVFSPDTMALMEDASQHCTIEFTGSRIYIYADGFVSNIQHITELFTLAKKLLDKLGPLATRLRTDTKIVPPRTNPPVSLLASRDVSLQFGRKDLYIVLLGFVIAIIVALALFVAIVFFARSQTSTESSAPQTLVIPSAGDSLTIH